MLLSLTPNTAYATWGFVSESDAKNAIEIIQYKEFKVCGVPVRLGTPSSRNATGSTYWRASLDHGRDIYSCIRNLLVHLDLQQKTFSPRMLRSPHNQLPLLHRNSTGILSHMSTFSLQLESFHSRDMWRPEVLVPIHWGLQLFDGRYYRSFTVARFMGPSDADRKENRFEYPVLHGYSVWMTPNPNHISLQSTT